MIIKTTTTGRLELSPETDEEKSAIRKLTAKIFTYSPDWEKTQETVERVWSSAECDLSVFKLATDMWVHGHTVHSVDSIVSTAKQLLGLFEEEGLL